MRFCFCLLFVSINFTQSIFGQNNLHTLYLIPGIAADGRIFQNLKIENCDTIILEFLMPEKNELLPDYSKRMAEKIDTSKPFSLLGVSFGGMIAVEMAKFLHPEKVFIVSSVKTRNELPFHYRFMKYVPLYKLFGGKSLNRLANFARPIWEPESRQQTSVFRAMTNDTPSKLIQRSVHCIAHWENKKFDENVIHIQGEKDHTLPIKKIINPVAVKDGSHEMILIRAEEVSKIIHTKFEEQGMKVSN